MKCFVDTLTTDRGPLWRPFEQSWVGTVGKHGARNSSVHERTHAITTVNHPPSPSPSSPNSLPSCLTHLCSGYFCGYIWVGFPCFHEGPHNICEFILNSQVQRGNPTVLHWLPAIRGGADPLIFFPSLQTFRQRGGGERYLAPTAAGGSATQPTARRRVEREGATRAYTYMWTDARVNI